MTGTERPRTLADAWGVWAHGERPADMAGEIERERACDADTIENVRLIVGGVIDDMERHILGHEGMEDSPVARWARELRYALKSDTSDERDAQNPSWHDHADAAGVTSDAPKVTRDPAEDVSMSAYDLLPADERDAIAWVLEHGGLDYVRAEWRSRVPYDRYVRRSETISKLTHRVSDLTRENAELRKRAMPEGCQWPRYESGESVGFDDDVSRNGEDFEVKVIALYCDGSFSLNFWAYSKGERVKRVKRPVFDADGVPIKVGDTVWDTETGCGRTVRAVNDNETVEFDGHENRGWFGKFLTHTKPEPQDSAERIAEDIRRMAEEWCSYPSLREASEKAASSVGEATMGVALGNLSKRCRALAERERGE